MVHPEFGDDDLVLVDGFEKRQRQADLVVFIVLGFVRAELLADYRGDHAAGRGLAHAPRDPDDGREQGLAVAFRDALVGIQGVLDEQEVGDILFLQQVVVIRHEFGALSITITAAPFCTASSVKSWLSKRSPLKAGRSPLGVRCRRNPDRAVRLSPPGVCSKMPSVQLRFAPVSNVSRQSSPFVEPKAVDDRAEGSSRPSLRRSFRSRHPICRRRVARCRCRDILRN